MGYVLAVKVPAVAIYGGHDPSAALFKDGELVHGVEEERFNRIKHGGSEFPSQSVEYCLNQENIDFDDLDKVLFTYHPKFYGLKFTSRYLNEIPDVSGLRKIKRYKDFIGKSIVSKSFKKDINRRLLSEVSEGNLPEIEFREHHYCHAASAFHPSGFEDALVVTADGRGEIESTVIWRADRENGLEKLEVFEWPNSLGTFYGIITEFLGYHKNNGEGKVMGLAPYGSQNPEIEEKLLEKIEVGPDYDVTWLTENGVENGVEKLEELFDRERNTSEGEFDQWEKDLAFVTQRILENTVTSLVSHHLDRLDTSNVCLAGGVALNCKMNKEVMEMQEVEDIFIQPVASDGGLVLGAGMSYYEPHQISEMTDAYLGPSYLNEEVEEMLDQFKLDYRKPDNLEEDVAEKIADGSIVGWFQGGLEMGPRALGNRSILADPRTQESRDRVNKYVKNREEWRPFAPSMLEEAAEDYLENARPAPFMIKTFDVKEEKRNEITAALHPGDATTRPQTVNKEQNPRYYKLIKSFEEETGVPIVLNTSFNDHGEPIVNTPKQAIKDFFAMGLDYLVVEDYIVSK